jgi:hypothetical protein
MAHQKNKARSKKRAPALTLGPTRVIVETGMGHAIVKIEVGPKTTIENLCDSAIQVAFDNQPKFTAHGPMFRTVEDLQKAARVRFPDLFPMEVDGDPDFVAAMQGMIS